MIMFSLIRRSESIWNPLATKRLFQIFWFGQKMKYLMRSSPSFLLPHQHRMKLIIPRINKNFQTWFLASTTSFHFFRKLNVLLQKLFEVTIRHFFYNPSNLVGVVPFRSYYLLQIITRPCEIQKLFRKHFCRTKRK